MLDCTNYPSLISENESLEGPRSADSSSAARQHFLQSVERAKAEVDRRDKHSTKRTRFRRSRSLPPPDIKDDGFDANQIEYQRSRRQKKQKKLVRRITVCLSKEKEARTLARHD